jgi:hypothetical protein
LWSASSSIRKAPSSSFFSSTIHIFSATIAESFVDVANDLLSALAATAAGLTVQ